MSHDMYPVDLVFRFTTREFGEERPFEFIVSAMTTREAVDEMNDILTFDMFDGVYARMPREVPSMNSSYRPRFYFDLSNALTKKGVLEAKKIVWELMEQLDEKLIELEEKT